MKTGFKHKVIDYICDRSLINGSLSIVGNNRLLLILRSMGFKADNIADKNMLYDLIYLSYKNNDMYSILNHLNRLSDGGLLLVNMGKSNISNKDKYKSLIPDRIYPSVIEYTTDNNIECEILVLKKGR